MKLDSRFDYQFSIANGVLQTILNPVSDPVGVTFRFKGEPEDLQKRFTILLVVAGKFDSKKVRLNSREVIYSPKFREVLWSCIGQ